MTLTQSHTCPRRFNGVQMADTWQDRDGKRHCDYCGSLHPDDVIERIKAGELVVPTDKDYKIYVGAHEKAYFQHFAEKHMVEFVQLYNRPEGDGKMNIGVPGHFYTMPFFMTYKEPKK